MKTNVFQLIIQKLIIITMILIQKVLKDVMIIVFHVLNMKNVITVIHIIV